MIEKAAEGSPADRETFAESYLPAILAYLQARWRSSLLLQDAEDAAQEVFVECFRSALRRTNRDRGTSFRGFLYGVVRNVARRFEERQATRRERQPESASPAEDLAAEDASLSDVFDGVWAESVLGKARQHQVERAREKGDGALRRLDLLRLRLEDDLPIREFA